MSRRSLRFPALVGNEFRKPFHRASTYVMFGMTLLLCVLGILFSFLQQTFSTTETGSGAKLTDKEILTQRIQADQTTLDQQRASLKYLEETGAYPDSFNPDGGAVPTLEPALLKMELDGMRLSISMTEKDLALAQYRYDHGMPADEGATALGYAAGQGWIVQLLTLFAIVLMSIGVASEFTGGTIRLLLTRPFRRWKILLSKYLGVYAIILCMLAGTVVMALLGGVLLHGFTSSPYLTYANGTVQAVPMILFVLAQFGLACISLLLFSTMAFMIASVFRTSALSIGLSLFLMFLGTTVTSLIYALGTMTGSGILKGIVRFSMFSYTDLTPYVFGTPTGLYLLPTDASLGYAVAVLAVYYVLFLGVAFFGFTKRDIA